MASLAAVRGPPPPGGRQTTNHIGGRHVVSVPAPSTSYWAGTRELSQIGEEQGRSMHRIRRPEESWRRAALSLIARGQLQGCERLCGYDQGRDWLTWSRTALADQYLAFWPAPSGATSCLRRGESSDEE